MYTMRKLNRVRPRVEQIRPSKLRAVGPVVEIESDPDSAQTYMYGEHAVGYKQIAGKICYARKCITDICDTNPGTHKDFLTIQPDQQIYEDRIHWLTFDGVLAVIYGIASQPALSFRSEFVLQHDLLSAGVKVDHLRNAITVAVDALNLDRTGLRKGITLVDTAIMMHVKPWHFTNFLCASGWLYRASDRDVWQATDIAIQRGFLIKDETRVQDPFDGPDIILSVVLVSQAGLRRLISEIPASMMTEP